MWAYFVKDVKENARWGLLATLLLGGLLAYLLYRGSHGGTSNSLSLVGETYLTGTRIGFAAAGLAIGLAVVLGDARRGHWGFAVHRPLPRWRIFAAKALAGAAVYGVAGAVAVAVAAVLGMTPRVVVAPFAVSMLQPTLYHALAGLMWLAAGLLVGVRRAHWLGSRTLPALGSAIVVTYVDAWAIHFYEAATAVLAMAAVFAAAATAAFVHNGDDDGRGRPLTAVAVGLGVAALLMFTAAVAGGVIALFAPPDTLVREVYVLDNAGRPYRLVLTKGGRQVYDLQGHRLTPEDQAWFENHTDNVARVSPSDPLDPARPRSWRYYDESFLRNDRYLQFVNSDRDLNAWYIVPSRRTIEGHARTGRYVGSLGPGGARAADRPPEPFPQSPRTAWGPDMVHHLVLTTRERVWLCDIDRGRIRPAYDAPAGQRLFSANLVPASGDEETDVRQGIDTKRPARLLVVTAGVLHVLPVYGGGTPVDLPIGSGRYWTRSSALLRPDGRLYVLTNDFPGLGDGPAALVTLFEGREISRVPLPPLPPTELRPTPVVLPIAAISPPALAATPAWWAGDDEEMAARPPPGFRVTAVVAALAGVLATLWAARRSALGRGTTAAWSVLAVVFGLVAPLTLLCLARRPARARCPACGRPRVVDHDDCEHCGARFPPPGDPATAVFDPPRSAA